MKLEAIDPLNLSTICVATIRKVREWLLKHRNAVIETGFKVTGEGRL